jgi:predicted phage tail protein
MSGPGSFSDSLTSLTAETTYHFRAKAVGDGTTPGSDMTFTTSAIPQAPTLTLPVNGAAVNTSPPTLDWSDVTVPSGVTYQLQLDDNADFSSLVLTKVGLMTSTYTLTAGEAIPDDVYYWKVRAVDGAGSMSVWTSAWSLAVDTAAPPVPVLTYPSNGKVTNDSTPYLDWTTVTDSSGVTYQLQVDDNSDFSSPVVNKTGLTSSSCTVTTVLSKRVYYWRVRAVDKAGNMSAWTRAWSLTVQ